MHYIDDVLHHVAEKQKKYPDIPIFLYGHSMVSRASYIHQNQNTNHLFHWRGLFFSKTDYDMYEVIVNSWGIFLDDDMTSLGGKFPSKVDHKLRFSIISQHQRSHSHS
jgi:hypothetical protein